MKMDFMTSFKNTKKAKRLILVCFLCLLVSETFSQSKILEGYVQEGLKNNLALKQRNFSVEKSVAALKEAKSMFWPEISVDANYTLSEGGRSFEFPLGDLFNPVYANLNAINGNAAFKDLDNVKTFFLPNDFHETRIRGILPILNTDIYYNIKAKKHLVSIEEAKKEAYKKELVKEIKVAYYRYQQANDLLTIHLDNQVLLKELVRVNKKLVSRQKVTKDKISSAEYELYSLESELINAEKDKQLALAYFNFLLNRDLDLPIEASTVVQENFDINYDLEGLEKQAIQRREELKQLKSGKDAADEVIKLNQYKAIPTISAVGDLGYQGEGYTFDTKQEYWMVQFRLNWPLFRGFYNKRKIQQARIERSILHAQYKELEQKISLEMKSKYYSLMAANAKIKSSKAGLRSAESAFKVINKKYKQRLASLLEYLESKTNLSNAKVALAISKYEYLINKAALERAMAL